MILRLVLLLTIPAMWVWLIMAGASEVERSHTLPWTALPLAIAVAYLSLAIGLAFGVRVPPFVLAISLAAVLAAAIGNAIFGLGSDGLGRLFRVTEYAVWAVAFGGAALSVWHRTDASWPRDGYIIAIAVQVLMAAPPLTVLAAWFFVMMFSG